MVRSKSSFVSPAATAMPTPCRISGASSPSMCAPSTRRVRWQTTSFISAFRPSRPLIVCRMGVNRARWMSTGPSAAASASVIPTVPIGGEVKTAVGTFW